MQRYGRWTRIGYYVIGGLAIPAVTGLMIGGAVTLSRQDAGES